MSKSLTQTLALMRPWLAALMVALAAALAALMAGQALARSVQGEAGISVQARSEHSTSAGSLGGPRASIARIRCRPGQGTSTLAHSARARIFSDAASGNDYACLYSNGHARYLSSTEHYEYRHVRFAGSYVAFVVNIEAGDDHVGVLNLRTGRLRNYQPVRPIENSVCAQVDSLVLKPDGALAWIATNFQAPYCVSPPGLTIEVRSHDRHGAHVLDSGVGIAPSSLRLTGSVVHWIDGALMRSAALS